MQFISDEEKAKQKKEVVKTAKEESADHLTSMTEESAPEKIPEITLEYYLKAGYSLIYIRTDEDHRAVEMVKAAITSIDAMYGVVHYGEWKSTTGLMMAPGGQLEIPDKTVQTADDPVASLLYLQTNEQQMVICFHNLRQFLSLAPVVQQLKDAAVSARLIGSHIILIGAELDPPPELQSLITVYDLGLPSKEKFSTEFKALAAAYSQSLKEPATPRVIEIAASSAVGMTQLQGENAIALSIAMQQKLSPHIIQLEKEQAIKRNDVLEFVHSLDTMDELAGFGELKSWVDKRKDAYTPEAQEYGLRFPKGILLVGVPGCGKSLAAKCIAHYLEVPLLKFDVGKVFRSLVGASEQAVRTALKTAEAVSPVVLWLEEMEKSMAGSQSSGSTDSGTTARVMSTILTWMQENRKPVFLVATANNVEALPPELLRKGRFSEIWGVIEPNEEERKDCWQIHIRKVRPDRVDEFDYVELVKISDKYTGAEIEGIVEEAMFDAFKDNRREMVMEDLVAATGAVIPQAVMCRERIDTIRDWMGQKARYVSGINPHTKILESKSDKVFRSIRTDVEKTFEAPDENATAESSVEGDSGT